MERITGEAPLPGALRGGVAAIGNFDGFHIGHQAVVGRALARARTEGLPALTLTFDPHPARLFRPQSPPFMLTTTAQKLDLLETFGIDAAVVLRFDAAFAALPAEAFVADVLMARLGLVGVVTGEDFTFGRGAGGDTAKLLELGAPRGLIAETVAPVRDEGAAIISSTRVRAALQAGHCREAAALMGRPFAIRGTVEHGDKRGRTIDVPTANVAIGGEYVRPAYGIYAVRCRLEDGRLVDGVANLGIRPMFTPPKELLEVHLFDFAGDLYGQAIETQLIAHLRPEMKLASLEALKAQIAKDIVDARAALQQGKP
ncbi:MAG: bifunctional riboflavin kinase/FAD synthetase [Gemmatimonadaceae bacterium]|nr:bifunctional riboflavin kinase/FAD synthetase [Gemmatimonadaceae bacterium]